MVPVCRQQMLYKFISARWKAQSLDLDHNKEFYCSAVEKINLDSEGSQVEPLSLNICQIDFRLCQNHQFSLSCEHKVGRGTAQEYFAEKCPFCIPNLASDGTHGASVIWSAKEKQGKKRTWTPSPLPDQTFPCLSTCMPSGMPVSEYANTRLFAKAWVVGWTSYA